MHRQLNLENKSPFSLLNVFKRWPAWMQRIIPPRPPLLKGGEGSVLQKQWVGDRVILTWYAAKPVKGFHILRSTTKDGDYQRITKTPIPYIGAGIEGVTGQIFRFTYTDRSVQKGKDYYYRLETILKEEGKTASWQQ